MSSAVFSSLSLKISFPDYSTKRALTGPNSSVYGVAHLALLPPSESAGAAPDSGLLVPQPLGLGHVSVVKNKTC